MMKTGATAHKSVLIWHSRLKQPAPFQYLFEITTLFTGLVLASQDPPFEYDYFCNEHKTESHADLD